MWRMVGFALPRMALAAGSLSRPLPLRITLTVHGGWSSRAHPTAYVAHAGALYLPLGRLLIRL
jgi:hypothetical protein